MYIGVFLFDLLSRIESDRNPIARNDEANAQGILQITPIMKEDCTRIAHKDFNPFSVKDSFEMMMIYQGHYMRLTKPDLGSEEQIFHTITLCLIKWRLGPMSEDYALRKHGQTVIKYLERAIIKLESIDDKAKSNLMDSWITLVWATYPYTDWLYGCIPQSEDWRDRFADYIREYVRGVKSGFFSSANTRSSNRTESSTGSDSSPGNSKFNCNSDCWTNRHLARTSQCSLDESEEDCDSEGCCSCCSGIGEIQECEAGRIRERDWSADFGGDETDKGSNKAYKTCKLIGQVIVGSLVVFSLIYISIKILTR